jgi:galactitol-specific phosphotransferase system IIB component
MLGHAITAKTAKLDKKLKMIDLQLKKVRLDQQSADEPTPVTGTGMVLNRNELLEKIINGTKQKPKNE